MYKGSQRPPLWKIKLYRYSLYVLCLYVQNIYPSHVIQHIFLIKCLMLRSFEKIMYTFC